MGVSETALAPAGPFSCAGGVIFCAPGLNQPRPEAGHLLGGICECAEGDAFAPAIALDKDELAEIAKVAPLP